MKDLNPLSLSLHKLIERTAAIQMISINRTDRESCDTSISSRFGMLSHTISGMYNECYCVREK